MADVAVVARLGNGAQDRRVVQFLRVVQVMPPWIARRVVMQEVGVVLPNGFVLCRPLSVTSVAIMLPERFDMKRLIARTRISVSGVILTDTECYHTYPFDRGGAISYRNLRIM